MIVGEVVRLQSGGPRMTVINAYRDYAEVQWVDDVGHMQKDIFPNACLTRRPRPWWRRVGAAVYNMAPGT